MRVPGNEIGSGLTLLPKKSVVTQGNSALDCKQALRMGYSDICFRMARGQKLRSGQISEKHLQRACLQANSALKAFSGGCRP